MPTIELTGDTYYDVQLTHDSADPDMFLDNVRVCVIGESTPYSNLTRNVSSTPPSHDFGAIPINMKRTDIQSFVIANDGNVTVNPHVLRIDNIHITGTHANDFYFTRVPRIFPLRLAAGQSITVDLYFDPRLAGEKTASLDIVSNADNAATLSVPLTGNATGASGLACAVIDFEAPDYTAGVAFNRTTVYNITVGSSIVGAA